MSDIEEPPTKVSKYESDQMEESQEDGQEEWLSEEMLTDDDYNPTNEHDVSDSAIANNSQMSSSQEDTNLTSQEISENFDNSNLERVDDSNIEDTLNTLDTERQNDLPKELETYLIKKTTDKPVETVKNLEAEESDGNDTDDLLRMLEDDGKVKKTKSLSRVKEKQKQKPKLASSDDDDDFIYKGQSARKLKVAKSVLMRKVPATKAVPEDSSESGDSSEDEEAGTKRFAKRPSGYAAKSTATRSMQLSKVTSGAGFKKNMDKRPTSTPNKQKLQTKTSLKRGVIPNGQQVVKQVVRHVHSASKVVNKTVDRITAVKNEPRKSVKSESFKEHDEIIDEEEFKEFDDFDLDEDFATESDSEMDPRARKQRIMKPEQVDEDMLSDLESFSEDEDSYNEFPSSDSDDMEDWFTLDIRTEKAGDYLPLLGANAYELLQEEKKRVSLRLMSLKESLTNLTANGRRQSDKLKSATTKLAEIEDMLKAS